MNTSIKPFKSNYTMDEPAVPPPSEHVDTVQLAAGVAALVNVPQGARFVTFGSTGDFFASSGAEPAIPGPTALDGSAPECNPRAWRLSSADMAIGLVAPAACTVTLAYHR